LALFDHKVFDPLQRWILSESGLEFRSGVIQCTLKPGCHIVNLVEEELGPQITLPGQNCPVLRSNGARVSFIAHCKRKMVINALNSACTDEIIERG
jgi:hypothetical protein